MTENDVAPGTPVQGSETGTYEDDVAPPTRWCGRERARRLDLAIEVVIEYENEVVIEYENGVNRPPDGLVMRVVVCDLDHYLTGWVAEPRALQLLEKYGGTLAIRTVAGALVRGKPFDSSQGPALIDALLRGDPPSAWPPATGVSSMSATDAAPGTPAPSHNVNDADRRG